ncbi:MAG TPA: M48 family metallopeptidase [Phycisphaerales bacterium]|nr:M48 family metallopeptidase [Phycisphaerales bacterium]
MQLFPIVIVGIVIAASRGAGWALGAEDMSALEICCLVWGPVAVIVAVCWWKMRNWARTVNEPGGRKAFRYAERFAISARTVVVVNHGVSVLGLGWLGLVREGIAKVVGGSGNLVLVDEFVAMLPALAGVVGIWWAYYPMELRLRERMLAAQLDSGASVHPMPSRWTYVVMQARLHLVMMMAPLLLIAGMSELVGMLLDTWASETGHEWVVQVVELASAGTVFVFSPLVVRWLLDVERLADGELRQALTEICRRHKVSVREILVWKTEGTVINAAVMGIMGWFRYVLLTDGLLETMHPRELKAVMAHEVAHVQRKHIPWMIVSLLALLTGGMVASWGVLVAADHAGVQWNSDSAQSVVEGVQEILPLLVVLVGFGWVSRRMERQADTFAVQDMSVYGVGDARKDAAMESDDATRKDVTREDGVPKVTGAAVGTMMNALEVIARLHMVDVRRRSWRHGSILWRQEYLGGLVGQPVDRLKIDRQVRWIKAGSALLLGGALAVLWKLGLMV